MEPSLTTQTIQALREAFRRHIAGFDLPPGVALVAVSGGPDSVTLLDLLVQSRDVHQQELIVAHADHGIHPDSGMVAEQVQALAASYRLPVHVGRLELGPGAGETKARRERYAWLEVVRVRVGAGLIFTAHHADDQIETVLMRALAGSGPAGLAGMVPVSGRLVRPLLPFRRIELAGYLGDSGLGAWLDPANDDRRHLRSWLRADVLPSLRTRLPNVDASLLRTSRQASRDRSAWNALLDVIPGLDMQGEGDGISVAAPSLEGYDSSLTQALILALARRAGCQLGPGRLSRVSGLLRSGTSGSQVPIGGGWVAELAFGRLRFRREAPAPPPATWNIEERTGRGSWGRWLFRWSPGMVPERFERAAETAWFTFEPLTIRAWAAGDRVKPLGGSGRRLVVRCFQDAEVPRSRRESWPVLSQNEEIVWIPGVCRSDGRLPSPGSEALRVDAEYA